MAPPRIALSGPDIGETERRLVNEVLSGTSLACGPVLESFEREFAARVGSEHAVAVSSGTAGLHLAVVAEGVQQNDFVITTPFSFVASANVVLYERATPVFVDIDEETLMPAPEAIIETAHRMRTRTGGWQSLLPRRGVHGLGLLRAILPVHVFGRPADLRSIIEAARQIEVSVIEDACEAVGASVDGRAAGTLGDSGVFAFYPNKQMTTGEGGMIVTNDASRARLFRILRNQGREDHGEWLRHTLLGYNYRMDEMSAAMGLGQLRRLDELLAKRRAVADTYTSLLEPITGIAPLLRPENGTEHGWFVYAVRVDAEIDRDDLMRRLAERGVPSRPYFTPIHLQPLYAGRFGFQPGDFPRAEEAGRTILALPFHTGLSQSDLEYVVDQIRVELPNARRPAPAIAAQR